MGSITSVYLTDEIREMLDERKKKDPDFNLSALIEESLLKQKEYSVSEIIILIEKKKNEINMIKNEVELLESQKAKIEARNKLEQEEKERNILINERRRIDFINTYSKNMTEFFEISKKEAENIAEIIFETPKELRTTIFDECRSRGFKEKYIK